MNDKTKLIARGYLCFGALCGTIPAGTLQNRVLMLIAMTLFGVALLLLKTRTARISLAAGFVCCAAMSFYVGSEHFAEGQFSQVGKAVIGGIFAISVLVSLFILSRERQLLVRAARV